MCVCVWGGGGGALSLLPLSVSICLSVCLSLYSPPPPPPPLPLSPFLSIKAVTSLRFRPPLNYPLGMLFLFSSTAVDEGRVRLVLRDLQLYGKSNSCKCPANVSQVRELARVLQSLSVNNRTRCAFSDDDAASRVSPFAGSTDRFV